MNQYFINKYQYSNTKLISKITLFIENHIFANIILSTQNVFDSLLNNKIQGQSLE